jgi:hypothetical protein
MPNEELISKELFDPIALSYEKLPEPTIIPKGFILRMFFLSSCEKPELNENKNKKAKNKVFN